MEVRGDDSLELAVNDRGAQYPVTIDPLFANVEARLVQSSVGDMLGSSVALSGNTALVGVPGKKAALIFLTYEMPVGPQLWSQEAELSTDEEGSFGNYVALSNDTAVVGPHVFVRSGSDWIKQARLTASDGTELKSEVAISGETILIGAHVFVRSGTEWTQQAKLPSDTGETLQGPVALSADTALASGVRKVYAFKRVGTTWNSQGKLVVSNPDSYYNQTFGSSLALSGDTALV